MTATCGIVVGGAVSWGYPTLPLQRPIALNQEVKQGRNLGAVARIIQCKAHEGIPPIWFSSSVVITTCASSVHFSHSRRHAAHLIQLECNRHKTELLY